MLASRHGTTPIHTARAMDRFLEERGIRVEVVPLDRHVDVGISKREMVCHIGAERDGRRAQTTIPTGWTSGPDGIAKIDHMAHSWSSLLNDYKWTARMERCIRREGGRAELFMRTIFQPEERLAYRELARTLQYDRFLANQRSRRMKL